MLDLNNIKNLVDIKFKVLSDINCSDCCWNRPSEKLLKKGTIVKFNGSANNGDIFITNLDNDKDTYIISRTNAVKTRYPYDKGLLNLKYLKPLNYKINLDTMQ